MDICQSFAFVACPFQIVLGKCRAAWEMLGEGERKKKKKEN